MNLLGELEGKKQEVLVSTLLRYLLSGSHELRSTFFDSLVRMLGPIGSGNHFATYLEFSTHCASLGNGRLDVLIETDEALIGLEVKIWAGFQGNQPEKYVSSLTSRASELMKLRRVSEYPCFLVVLAPDFRRDRMEKELARKCAGGLFQGLDESCKFLAWEELLERFEETKGISASMLFLVGELQSYFRGIEGALSNFSALAPRLHRWKPKGSRWHRDVLGGLWRLLPGSGGRLGASELWCGYRIQSDNGSVSGWYGFVAKEQFINPEDLNSAELIFQLDRNVPEWESHECALPNQLKSKDYKYTWVIRFDESWKTTTWHEFLEPLQQLLSETVD